MDFITLEDVVDEIVTCTQADIDDANDYLFGQAKRLRVSEARIVLPPVYTAKRLGIVYALYNAAVRSIGKDNLTGLDAESTRQDIYAQKAKFFKAELDKLETSVTADDFVDNKGTGNIFAIPMWFG